MESPGDRKSLLIRRALPSDADALRVLIPRLVAFGPPPWRDPKLMTQTDIEVISRAVQAEGSNPVVYVAQGEAGDLAGFIHLHSATDYYRRRDHGHVADIVVAEAYEGQGLATALLAKAEEWARGQGFDWLTISVFETNGRAAGLYERLGFGRDIARLVKPLT
jgi:ribosomal protein S18 acetylase RimI-like enzyme